MFTRTHFVVSSHEAFKKSTALLLALFVVFGLFEPVVSYGFASATSTFLINQTITDEISFSTAAASTTMVGSILGLTGGEATGTTQVVVRSNSFTGYTMDIAFSNTPAMRGASSSNTSIRNYATSTPPSFTYISSTSAQFAYTVSASTTADIAQTFLNNGTSCGIGGSSTFGRCWAGPSTTNYRIINRTSPMSSTGGYATTTITFRLVVPGNPTPSVDADVYQATATLTATNQ